MFTIISQTLLLRLFSFSECIGRKAIKQGWKLSGDSEAIKISKGSTEKIFDIKIKTKDGWLFAAHIEPQNAMALTVTDAGKRMSV